MGRDCYYRYIHGILTPSQEKRQLVQAKITQLYLEHKGVIGYRMMYRPLVQQGIIKLNEYFQYQNLMKNGVLILPTYLQSKV